MSDTSPAHGPVTALPRAAATGAVAESGPGSADRTAGPGSADSTVTEIELAVGGMTCASCANRIERKLNKLDGVTATVNYATEKARISAPAASGSTPCLGPSRRPATPPPRRAPSPTSIPSATCATCGTG